MGDGADLGEGRVPLSAGGPRKRQGQRPESPGSDGGGPRSDSGLPNWGWGPFAADGSFWGPLHPDTRGPGWPPSACRGHREGALSDVPSRPGGHWPILSSHPARGLGPCPLTVLPAVPSALSNCRPLGLGQHRQGPGLLPARGSFPHHSPSLLLAFAAGAPGGGDRAGGIGEGAPQGPAPPCGHSRWARGHSGAGGLGSWGALAALRLLVPPQVREGLPPQLALHRQLPHAVPPAACEGPLLLPAAGQGERGPAAPGTAP